MKRVDLHVHTTASDGSLSPSEIVLEASRLGISAVGITDHDTMQGVPDAEAAGKKHGVEVVPGVELSTSHKKKEIHILGYYCDPNNPIFKKTLQAMKADRLERMVAMLAKLKTLGIDVEMADVWKGVKGQMLGRPHLAVALTLKGYCQTPSEAFKKFIGKKCPAYVERLKITSSHAISLIRGAGGVPVLAHPGLYQRDYLIPSLVKAGLLGMEVFHPNHGVIANLKYLRLARKYNLLVTGGSDYHGGELGSAPRLGAITVNYSYLKKMKQVREAIEKV